MKRILVIDDDPMVRDLLKFSLSKMGYEIKEAEDGVKAMLLAHREFFDLILLDVFMPNMDGIETLEKIREQGKSVTSPVIMITSDRNKKTVESAIKMGAVDYVVKPFDTGSLLHKIGRWINVKVEESWKSLKPEQENVLRLTITTLDSAFEATQQDKELPYENLIDTCKKMVNVIEDGNIQDVLNAVKQHDSYTFVHSMRVGIYLSVFSREFGGFTKDDILTITAGGVIHDVGKAKTPLTILNKATPFEPSEWEEMKEHVAHTVEILRRTPGIPEAIIEIGWSHHEKLDGTGYPRRLKGEEIGTLARMASIVDAYVALTDRRVYKPAWPKQKAFEVLENARNHFDSKLVMELKEIIMGMASY